VDKEHVEGEVVCFYDGDKVGSHYIVEALPLKELENYHETSIKVICKIESYTEVDGRGNAVAGRARKIPFNWETGNWDTYVKIPTDTVARKTKIVVEWGVAANDKERRK
jgi:hypothetical protein